MSNLKTNLPKKSNNINSSNIKPFTEKIKFDISDILSNDNTGLPLIPGIYFVQKTTYEPKYITHPLSPNKNNTIYEYDNIGSEAISKYHNIKNLLYKLDVIKNFIISIINNNKKLFETIKISQKKYNLTKNNVFFKFKEKLNDNFISVFGENNKETKILTTIKKQQQNINPQFKNPLKNFKTQNPFPGSFRPQTKFTIQSPIKYTEIQSPIKTNGAILYKDKDIPKITIYLFIRAFIKNNYNLLKKKSKSLDNSDNLDFMYIFQKEFNKKSKSFFYKLFQEYVRERNKLIKYVSTDYGILAFNFIFDLKYKLNTPNTNINPNENIDSYKIINKEIDINSNNKYNIGDVLYSNKDYSNKVGYVYKKDFSDTKPYTIKISNTNKLVNSNESNDYEKYNLKEMENKFHVKSKAKPTLQEKIHNFNLLYKNLIGQESIVSNYSKNINNIYSNFYKSIDNYLNDNSENNLFNVINNNLELDVNLFKFIFNYVDIGIFKKAVDINYKIKKYIDNKIDNFESKYESYILLFNQINNIISFDNIYKDDLDNLDFKNFLNNIIEKLNNNNNNDDNDNSESISKVRLNKITSLLSKSHSSSNGLLASKKTNANIFKNIKDHVKKLHKIFVDHKFIKIDP
jgi:hypothetical protein